MGMFKKKSDSNPGSPTSAPSSPASAASSSKAGDAANSKPPIAPAVASADGSATSPNSPTGDADVDHTEDDINEEDLEGKELDEDLEWDEGGPSQCGYNMTIHEFLMSTGETIHGYVGAPSKSLGTQMRRVGNFFQEASYAVRDVVRGENEMSSDTKNAWKELTGRSVDEEADDAEGDEDDRDDVAGSAIPEEESPPVAASS